MDNKIKPLATLAAPRTPISTLFVGSTDPHELDEINQTLTHTDARQPTLKFGVRGAHVHALVGLGV